MSCCAICLDSLEQGTSVFQTWPVAYGWTPTAADDYLAAILSMVDLLGGDNPFAQGRLVFLSELDYSDENKQMRSAFTADCCGLFTMGSNIRYKMCDSKQVRCHSLVFHNQNCCTPFSCVCDPGTFMVKRWWHGINWLQMYWVRFGVCLLQIASKISNAQRWCTSGRS